MAFVEDFAAYFSEFATPATLGGVAVQGIFDKAYDAASAGVGLATGLPVYTLATSAVPANPVGKVLVVASTRYKVAEHHPDGTGISLLLLELAA